MRKKLEELVELLKQQLGEKYEVYLTDVEKTDGVHISLSIKSFEYGYAMNYYLEHRIRAGEPLKKIANQIALGVAAEFKEQNRTIASLEEILQSWESSKPYLTACVCLQEGHEKYLEDKAWIGYLDLAVYFRLCVEMDDLKMEYVVTRAVQKMWGVSLEEMKAVADANRPEEQIRVLRMACSEEEAFACCFMPDIVPFAEELSQGFLDADMDVSMASQAFFNPGFEYGGSLIARPEILSKISENTGTDLLILPSSRDDIIVIPARAIDRDFYECQNNSVQEVNAHFFDGYDEGMILSDHAYIFSRDKKKLLEKWELDAYFEKYSLIISAKRTRCLPCPFLLLDNSSKMC